MTPAIELRNVGFAYGDRCILRQVDLALGPGEILALVGPSGGGKSTLLRLILGLEIPTTGEVRLDGVLVSSAGRLHVPPQRRRLAMVFQDLALWPHLSVAAHLQFVLRAQGVPAKERTARIARTLAWVDLDEHGRRHPGALSGGERQRVAIARALVAEPALVLLDEPLANLDVPLKQDLLALFRRLLCEQRRPAIYVTHEPREAFALADAGAVLEAGRITQHGPWSALRTQPASEFVRVFVADGPVPGHAAALPSPHRSPP